VLETWGKTGISPEPARHAPRKEIQSVGSAVQNQLFLTPSKSSFDLQLNPMDSG
jgi:hypothetical protein